MNDIKYFFHNDINNVVYSVDMVYVFGYLRCSFDELLNYLRSFHEQHSNIFFEEQLNLSRHSKYDFFQNGVRVDRCYLSWGRYSEFLSDRKEFATLPCYQIRFNPNKLHDQWFLDFLLGLDLADWVIRKLDFAIDLPFYIDSVSLPGIRKNMNTYDGTRYYGKSGRHGSVKVYDKKKEILKDSHKLADARRLSKESPITRVETTLHVRKDIKFDSVAYFDGSLYDFSSLKDTERSIVEMFFLLKNNGILYDLKLGRKMRDKLSPFLLGGQTVIDSDFLLSQYKDLLSQYNNFFETIFVNSSSMSIDNDFVFNSFEDNPFEEA